MKQLLVVVLSLFVVGCAAKQKVVVSSKPLGPKQLSQDELAELNRILGDGVLHFDYDDANLAPEDQALLVRLADELRARPWAAIRIEGHCDDRGTEEYNLALGQRRADVARKYLVELGVGPQQVTTVSFGEEVPAVEGTSEEAWAENRRDELKAETFDALAAVTE